MHTEEEKLAQAASKLTPKDLQWLHDHEVISDSSERQKCATITHTPQEDQEAASHEKNSQETASQEKGQSKKRKRSRRSVKHEWPEAASILQADYHGQHYAAEVIEAPQYKSGRAVRVLEGPAAGKTYSSMSGAMLGATEKQREEDGLGRKDVANGWKFWKTRKEAQR